MMRAFASTRTASAVASACAFSLAIGTASPVQANPARVARTLLMKGGKEASENAVSALARRIGTVERRHGARGVQAVERGGTRALETIETLGKSGGDADLAVRLFARHGDDALRITANPRAMNLVRAHGDDAARAIVRHPGVAEDVIGAHGRAGVDALAALSGRNARRLGMLADDGALAASGRADDLLRTIVRYGDAGMDFLWRHKGVLAGGAVLAAFLNDPEPFIDGSAQLVDSMGEHVAAPVIDVGKEAVKGVARPIGWALGAGVLVIMIVGGVRTMRRRERDGLAPRIDTHYP